MPCKSNISGASKSVKIIAGDAQQKDVRHTVNFVPNTGAEAPIPGTMPDCPVTQVIPGAEDKIIPAGSYIAQDIAVKGDPELVTQNIRGGAEIFGVPGNSNVVDTSDLDLTADDIRYGKKARVKGKDVIGMIRDCPVETVTPGAADIVIAAGQYLAKAIKVIGDKLFTETNIKADVTIFGKKGTFTKDATMKPEHLVAGFFGYGNGAKIPGSMADRGESQYARDDECGIAGDYFWIHIPAGWYHSKGSTWAPESRVKLTTFRNALGITADKMVNGASIAGVNGNRSLKFSNKISVCAIHSSSSSITCDHGPYEASFTAPADGYLVYGGLAECPSTSSSRNVTCEVYLNNTLIDNRNCNSSNTYVARTTMVNMTRAIKKGDVVRIKAQTNSVGTWQLASVWAMFAYM